MISNPMSGAAMDLGLGANLRNQAAAEQERLKKKQQQDAQMKRSILSPYSGAFMSLTGNQF